MLLDPMNAFFPIKQIEAFAKDGAILHEYSNGAK
jgi:hypothetical protein